jgi:3-oxoacyl-[acyl-carrier-protein] synthase-1
MRVFVVGTGIISALGEGTSENLKNLLLARSGLDDSSSYLDAKTDYLVGRVRFSNDELCNMFNLKTVPPRTSLLALYALNECLAMVPRFCKLGFISGTTTGGMAKSEIFFRNYIPKSIHAKTADIIYHSCSSTTDATLHNIHDLSYVGTINTACSSAANAIILGAQKIKAGQLDAVIAGGSDALCQFTLRGFQSLMILDKNQCKPFDIDRAGLNLGEGAGYLLLVSEDLARRHQLNPLCELRGYANVNDACHAAALSETGDGPYLAMQQALNNAVIAPTQVDYINLHGTGTRNNDSVEGAAIRRCFDTHFPFISSTKAYTGHTLGASGGIEAVFSVLSIVRQTVFKNLNFVAPMECGLVPVRRVTECNVRHVLSNSFGFGGNCSSLVFSKFCGTL